METSVGAVAPRGQQAGQGAEDARTSWGRQDTAAPSLMVSDSHGAESQRGFTLLLRISRKFLF